MDTEAGPRYAGTKSSRKELYGEPFGQVEASDEDEEDDSTNDDDEEGEGRDDEPLEEEDDDDEMSDDEDEDVDRSAENSSAASGSGHTKEAIDSYQEASGTNGVNSHLDKESRAMIQQLKKASSADIEKGRDVRKQLVG